MAELFPDFVTSPAAFEQAKEFWRKLAQEEADTLGQHGEWEKWFHEEEWREDSELMDGAVVFTWFSTSQHKGLRVQQYTLSRRSSSAPSVQPFMDVVGEGVLPRPIPNLFIGAAPTEANIAVLRRLVAHWFRKDISYEAMAEFIETEVWNKPLSE